MTPNSNFEDSDNKFGHADKVFRLLLINLLCKKTNWNSAFKTESDHLR